MDSSEVRCNKPARPTSPNTKKVACRTCNEAFLSVGDLALHMHEEHDLGGHDCQICGKTFQRKYNMRVHILTHATPKDRPFRCHLCPESFVQKSNFKRHLHTRHEKPVKCPGCSLRFATKEEVEAHAAVAHAGQSDLKIRKRKADTPSFSCPCKRQFLTLSELVSHQGECASRKYNNVIDEKSLAVLPVSNAQPFALPSPVASLSPLSSSRSPPPVRELPAPAQSPPIFVDECTRSLAHQLLALEAELAQINAGLQPALSPGQCSSPPVDNSTPSPVGSLSSRTIPAKSAPSSLFPSAHLSTDSIQTLMAPLSLPALVSLMPQLSTDAQNLLKQQISIAALSTASLPPQLSHTNRSTTSPRSQICGCTDGVSSSTSCLSLSDSNSDATCVTSSPAVARTNGISSAQVDISQSATNSHQVCQVPPRVKLPQILTEFTTSTTASKDSTVQSTRSYFPEIGTLPNKFRRGSVSLLTSQLETSTTPLAHSVSATTPVSCAAAANTKVACASETFQLPPISFDLQDALLAIGCV